MKPTFFRLLCALVVLALSASLAHAQTALATVRTATGQTQIRAKAGAPLSALARRRPLYAGNVVSTGANGLATLLFSDGAQVRLGNNASLEVTAPTKVGKNRSLFRAISGRVWARLRPGNAIQTRTVALGVRGTEIHLDVQDGDGTTLLTVVEGEVDFFNDYGAVVVGTSQSSIARPGLAPTAPVTVGNAGLLIEWTSDLDRAAVPREKFWISLDPAQLQPELARRRAAALAAPNDPDARRDLGDALFDLHQYEAAQTEYRAAAALEPREPQTQVRLGYVALELGQLDEAARAFGAANKQTGLIRVAAESESGNAAALTGLAWLGLERDRPADAQINAQRALDANVNVTRTSATRTSATGANPARDEALLALGVAQLRQPGERALAFETLQLAANAETPTSYAAHAWLALGLLDRNDNAGALREASLAVEMQPYSALAQGHLALAHFFSGNAAASQKHAQRAVELDADSAAARVALGQALLLRGDADGAATQAAQAVALDPKLPQGYYLLGVANAGQRDFAHAQRNLSKSLESSPDFLAAASALARVYNAMGQPEKARGVVNVVLERNPNSDAAQGALGAVFYEQGDYRGAEAQFRAALKTRPDSALYQAELARTLTYSNRLAEAIEAGQAAVRLAPQVGQYHAILGLALDFGRLDSQAEREFRLALTYDPRNALAMAQLALRNQSADLRPTASSLAQAFTHDPTVSQQLLRGGVRTELTPVGGSQGARNVGLTQRFTADEGRFNSLNLINREADAGLRNNDDSAGFSTSNFFNYTPSARTNIGLILRGKTERGGLRGSDLAPDGDDRADFRTGDVGVSVQQRLGVGQTLWLGVRGAAGRNITRDPLSNSFTTADGQFNIARQSVESRGFVPEVRYDLEVKRGTSRAGVFSLGAARAQTNFDLNGDLPLPVRGQTGRFRADENITSEMIYGQYAGRFSDKFSLIGQVRAQRIDRSQNGSLSILNQLQQLPGNSENRTHILPSFLGTYQAGRRTALRFSYNQRVLDATTSAFAPNETLVLTQRGAAPYGIPGNLRIAQVDIERTFGRAGFVRAFAFGSSANNLVIGGPDFQGFGGGLPSPVAGSLAISGWRGAGAGARLENRLGRNLFYSGGFTARSISADGYSRAPYEPRLLADLNLQYLSDQGYKAGVRLRHTGGFEGGFRADGSRADFASRNAVDLLLARDSGGLELFANVFNLFDRPQFAFENYNVGQRRLEFGVTRRF